jgi:hypothetical protein
VRGVVGNLDEEGPLCVLLDERDRALRDQVGHVAVDVNRRAVLVQIVTARLVGVLVIVDQSAEESEEVIEAVGVRLVFRAVTEMPLADEPRRVPVVLE